MKKKEETNLQEMRLNFFGPKVKNQSVKLMVIEKKIVKLDAKFEPKNTHNGIYGQSLYIIW